MFKKKEWAELISEVSELVPITPLARANAPDKLKDNYIDYLPTPHIDSYCIEVPELEHTYVILSYSKTITYLNLVIPRQFIWKNATILNKHQGTAFMNLDETSIQLCVENWLVPLNIPIFMLFHDSALRAIASWSSGMADNALKQGHSTTHANWIDEYYISIQRCYVVPRGWRKSPLDSGLIEQLKLDIPRHFQLAQTLAKTRVHIPSHYDDLMEWLKLRFFTPQNYPTQHAPTLALYQKSAPDLLMGWWYNSSITAVVYNAHHAHYLEGSTYHAGMKHLMFEALNHVEWYHLRTRILHQELQFKNTMAHQNKGARSPRKPLPALRAMQCVLQVHILRHDQAATSGWFTQPSHLHDTALLSAFKDVYSDLRPILLSYMIAHELELQGMSTILMTTPEGSIRVKDWHTPDGNLRLDNQHFGAAISLIWSAYPWQGRDLSSWMLDLIEARFIAGDLRVADLMIHHPNHVCIMTDVCKQHPRRARWLVSWLAHHPQVADGTLMQALFLLSDEQIISLDELELSAIYEQLESADTTLRQQHINKTKLIVTQAVTTLGASSFDLLDNILKDVMHADIMTHIRVTAENLPRLSAKRRALLREQKEAIANSDIEQGQLSLHHHDDSRQGALSTVDEPKT